MAEVTSTTNSASKYSGACPSLKCLPCSEVKPQILVTA